MVGTGRVGRKLKVATLVATCITLVTNTGQALDFSPGLHILYIENKPYIISVTPEQTTITSPLTIQHFVSDPDDPDDPDDNNSINEKLKKITEQYIPNGNPALKKLYETVAELPVTDTSQLKTATDTLFNALPLDSSIKEWKKEVDKVLSPLTLEQARSAYRYLSSIL